jgi:hypothetical protein
MTNKETISAIFEQLTPELSREGFKPDIKNQYFIRDSNDALLNFDIRFYNLTSIDSGEKGFQVEPMIYISVKAIEYFYKQITVNKYLSKPYHFITLGGAIANLEANPDGFRKKWNQSLQLDIFSPSDVDYVAAKILQHFHNTALPYCLQNGNVAAVDRLFNQYPEKNTAHISNEAYRLLKGIIAARLVHNPAIDAITSVYSKLVEEMPEDVRQEFERLTVLLRAIDLEKWTSK